MVEASSDKSTHLGFALLDIFFMIFNVIEVIKVIPVPVAYTVDLVIDVLVNTASGKVTAALLSFSLNQSVFRRICSFEIREKLVTSTHYPLVTTELRSFVIIIEFGTACVRIEDHLLYQTFEIRHRHIALQVSRFGVHLRT